MGVALFVTVWLTYRGVDRASDTITRGQADILHDNVRRELRLGRRQPTDADLDEIVAELEPDGLLYLAVLDGAGRLVAQGGAPPADIDALEARAARARPGDPVMVGGRVRTLFRGPRPPRRARHAENAAPPVILIEFTPRTASDLRASARGTFAIGAIGSGAFLMLALVLVRWLLRRTAVERKLAHERRLASLGEMSAVMAHELRNPLASLKGNAQLLARSLPEADKTRGKADLVVREAVRLEKLTNDLLEFARTGEIAVADADPVALLREVAADIPRVDVESDGAPARWKMDRERMRQVLANLIDNALQAGEGRVTAAVTSGAKGLVYRVRDRGPGIPADDLDKIFEPFVTTRTRGTGLGLAVAKRIVDLHGGSIAADNADGGGAVFTVTLPRT